MGQTCTLWGCLVLFCVGMLVVFCLAVKGLVSLL